MTVQINLEAYETPKRESVREINLSPSQNYDMPSGGDYDIQVNSTGSNDIRDGGLERFLVSNQEGEILSTMQNSRKDYLESGIQYLRVSKGYSDLLTPRSPYSGRVGVPFGAYRRSA